jgi:protein phosphatase
MEITADGLTDVGNVRKNNEDALLVRAELPLFAVADGVGGSAAGEIASQLFVAGCEYEFEAARNLERDPALLIKRCFHNANRKILDHVDRAPETRGMACTAEVLTFIDGEYVVGHVGDSRTYLIRDTRIDLITKDHSYVQEQLDLGLLKPEEAETHALRNAIYRAVGFEQEVEVDIYRGKVRDGDVFLLCSDGLSDMVSDEDMLRIAKSPGDVSSRVKALVDAAKAAGGRDNITVVLCEARVPPSLTQKIGSLLGLSG